MAYSAVPTRDTNDSNAFTDINQIQENTSLGKAAITATTTSYTITDTDGFGILKFDISGGTTTVTLPTAADNQDREITFLVSSITAASELIIDGEGAETINGTITATLRSKHDRCKILCDGTEWFILDMFASYETGWINRSDWTNVHPGSDATKNNDSDIAHNLGINFIDADLKFLISTGGTDATAFEVGPYSDGAAGAVGFSSFQVDVDNIQIVTGSSGLKFVNSTGSGVVIDTEDWYYNIKIARRI